MATSRSWKQKTNPKFSLGALGESRVLGSAVQLLNLNLYDWEMMNLCPVQSLGL